MSVLKENKRNYGIDVLRMLSMMMVVVLHTLGHGGILFSETLTRPNYYSVWFLEFLCLGAVNIFVLISGYVGSSKHFLSRALYLWLEVVFYCISIVIITNIFSPEEISVSSYLQAIFPITTRQYWFMSSYFGMLILSPALTHIVKNTSVKNFKIIMVAIIVFVMVLPGIWGTDPYTLSNGYSFAWFCIMYCIGAAIKHYELEIKSKFLRIKTSCTIVFIGGIIIAYSGKVIGDYIAPGHWSVGRFDGLFFSYTSPFIVFSAVGLVIFFSSLTFRNQKLISIIKKCSPLVLGIYLISDNWIIREHLITDQFKYVADKSIIVMIFSLVSFVCILYIVCLGIDFIRMKFFEILKIRQKCDNLITKVEMKLKENS